MNKTTNNYIPELKDELEDENAPDILINQQPQKRGNGKKKLFLFCIIAATVIVFNFFIKVDFPVTGVAHIVPSQMRIIEALESGVIEEVYVKEGETVAEGQTIARLVNRDLEREVDQGKYEVKKIRKKLLQLDRSRNYLRLALKNRAELYKDNVIARAELEKTKLDYTHTQQEYDIYQDELETIRDRMNFYREALDKMILQAPIQGIVLDKIENKEGTFAKKGDTICTIADMSDYLLEFPVNEKKIEPINIGMTATIRYTAFPRKPITGKVIRVQQEAWVKTRKALVKENVINVYIKPEKTIEDIRPGMTANIKIHSARIRQRQTFKSNTNSKDQLPPSEAEK